MCPKQKNLFDLSKCRSGSALQPFAAQRLKHILFEDVLRSAGLHLAHEIFLEGHLGEVHHLPFLNQLTLRGGICGRPTKAAPVSPMSARQIAFHVALASAALPLMSAAMFSTMAVTMASIMLPVLGAPVGTSVTSTGGMATQTPAAKMLGASNNTKTQQRARSRADCTGLRHWRRRPRP